MFYLFIYLYVYSLLVRFVIM